MFFVTLKQFLLLIAIMPGTGERKRIFPRSNWYASPRRDLATDLASDNVSKHSPKGKTSDHVEPGVFEALLHF